MKNTKNIRFAGQPKKQSTDKDSYIRVMAKDSCCDGNLQNACQDVIVVPLSTNTKTIKEVVFNGKTHTHPTGFKRTETDGLYNWLTDIIVDEEIDARLMVVFDDTANTVTITHTGVLKFESAKEGANVIAATRKCDVKVYCRNDYSIVGDPNNGDKVTIYKDNIAVELTGTFVYDNAGNAAATTANNTTAADLKTKIEAEWGAGSVLAVTPNPDCQCYIVETIVELDCGNYADNGNFLECDTIFV